MLTTALALAVTAYPSLAGGWVAIATNGVRVKESLFLTSDGRFKGSIIFTEKKWRSRNEAFKGYWRTGTLQGLKADELPGMRDYIELISDGKEPLPDRTRKFLLLRSVPAFTDIMTTTFAPIGSQAQVYRAMYGHAYKPPWK